MQQPDIPEQDEGASLEDEEVRQRVQGEFKKFKMSSPNSRPQSAQVPKPNAPFNKSRDKSQQLRVMKGTG